MSKTKTNQGIFRVFYLVEAGKDANGKNNVRRVPKLGTGYETTRPRLLGISSILMGKLKRLTPLTKVE